MLKGQKIVFLSKNLSASKKTPKRSLFNLCFISLKLVLGFLLLTFFLNYTPSLGYPPVEKISKAYAQDDAQTQTVAASDLPDSFQLPHPGYMSTPFSAYHPGIDIATGLGMPVHPIGKGTVIDAGFNFWGLGLMVIVDHGQGYKSLYGHLGKIYVSKNQKVDKNDLLGEVGLTGNTTGPHTHLEISKNDTRINPQTVLPTLRNSPQASDFQVVASASATLVSPQTYASASASLVALSTATANPTPTPTPSPTSTPTSTPTPTPENVSSPLPTVNIPDLLDKPKKDDSLTTVTKLSSDAKETNNTLDSSVDLKTVLSSTVTIYQNPMTSYQTEKNYRMLDIKSVLTQKPKTDSLDIIAILPRPQQ